MREKTLTFHLPTVRYSSATAVPLTVSSTTHATCASLRMSSFLMKQLKSARKDDGDQLNVNVLTCSARKLAEVLLATMESDTTPLYVDTTPVITPANPVVFELNVATILWAIANGILFVCILAGNALTIIAIRTCRRLRSMLANMLILSLAISDFIVGVTLPYHVAFYLGSNLGQSHGLCLLRFILIIFACCVSILTLISIAIDRYIAIVYALHYRRCMTRRVALFIIAVNWITGASVATIPAFWNHWSTASECEFNEVLPSWYMAGVITPGFVLIWTCMLLIYWRIMREASKQTKQLRKSAVIKRPTSRVIDWKSMQIVVFIMGCFSICWLPYFVVACAQIFHMCTITSWLYKAAFSLAISNSAFNPIIYCWKNSNFRRAFAQLLRCQSPNNADMSNWSVRSEHYLPKQPRMISISTIPLPLDQRFRANSIVPTNVHQEQQ